jgi:biotin carboxyl carrier protein
MKINVKIQDKTFNVEVGDIHARPIEATVDGERFEVWPEEARPTAVIPQPPTPKQVMPAPVTTPTPKAASANNVIAPIPGVIIEVRVKEGESVAYGQELCVLEAMKMKNSIRAGHAGVISKVLVSSGDSVQQGCVLMEFNDKAA